MTDFPVPLDRPLAFFDLETTGVKPHLDRIVEIGLVVVHQVVREALKEHAA